MPSAFRTHKPKRGVGRPHKPAHHRNLSRALPTNSAAWRALRSQILAADPLCIHCKQAGRVEPAVDVDHIDGDSSNNDPSNLQGLCRSCHSRKTARENGAFGR